MISSIPSACAAASIDCRYTVPLAPAAAVSGLTSFLRDGALANFFNLRGQQAHYYRYLVDLDHQFYQGKPATNQIEFVIVKRPALSIPCLRGHGILPLLAGLDCRSRSPAMTECLPARPNAVPWVTTLGVPGCRPPPTERIARFLVHERIVP